MTFTLDKATGNITIKSSDDGSGTIPTATLKILETVPETGAELFIPYDTLGYSNIDTTNKIVTLPLEKDGTTYTDIILKREIDDTYTFSVSADATLDNIGILLYTKLLVKSPQTFEFDGVNLKTIELLSDSDGEIEIDNSSVVQILDDTTNNTTGASISSYNANINIIGTPSSNFTGSVDLDSVYVYTMFGKYSDLAIDQSTILKIKAVDSTIDISSSSVNYFDISGSSSVIDINETKILDLKITDLDSSNINISDGSTIYNISANVDVVCYNSTLYNIDLPNSALIGDGFKLSHGIINELKEATTVYFIDPLLDNIDKTITINNIQDGEYIFNGFKTLNITNINKVNTDGIFKLISSDEVKTKGKTIVIENLKAPLEINSSEIEKVIIENIDTTTATDISINGSTCSLYIEDLKDATINISGSSITELNIKTALDNAKVNIISSIVDDITYDKEMKAEIIIVSSKIGNVETIYGKYPTN